MPDSRQERFIDRDLELGELRRLLDRDRPNLILLYGRRRVGKTYLLDHAWEGHRVFYFLAADTTSALNREELLRELAIWTGTPLNPADYPTWRTIFRYFVGLAAEAPLVVVLDEFQYLLGQQDDIVSQLVAVWDREVRDRPLTIALSSSEVATMERLQNGGQPLYGRPNWSARIRPFDYRDAARMVPNREPRQAAIIYGIFGGTPRYLASIDEQESLEEAVVRTFLSPHGEVHLQVQHVIEQEKGIRDPAAYRAVLAAIAGGETEVNTITQAAGLLVQTYTVRRALAVLEDLELIRRERNFDAPERAPYRYRIADNAVRFWYRFIHPNRGRLETGDPRAVWSHHVAPYLNDFMGGVFERLCYEAYSRYHASWGLAGSARWARWEGRDRNRRSIELDIVARLDDGRLLAGEIKWSSHPVTSEVHIALRRDLDDLAHSGRGWAHAAFDPDRSAGPIYFSAAGFSTEFRTLAERDGMVHLLPLETLYPAG